jgi:hypothetical protein
MIKFPCFIDTSEAYVDTIDTSMRTCRCFSILSTYMLGYVAESFKIKEMEARGVEPLSLRPSDRTSTCLSDR